MHILLVDDHTLFRDGVKFLLKELDKNLHIVEAKSFEEAARIAAEAISLDLVLLDLELPGLSGLDVLARAHELFAGTPIVVLSGEEDPRIVRATIDSGAMGFIPKSSTSDVLIHALRLILAKGIYLPPKVLEATITVEERALDASTARSVAAESGLSARQVEVLARAIEGKPNKVIARELNVSEATVKAHLSSVYRVLHVSNRTEAVYAAAKLGLRLS